MSKDPFESERYFREMLERSARPQTRKSRRWPITIGRALVLIGLVCLGSFIIFIVGVATKLTNAYACTLAEARRSPMVIAELGEPIEAGFFAWGNWERGTVTEAWYRTTLEGPKGEGTLRVQLYSSPLGSSLRMELEKDGRTQQFYNGSTPCR